MESPHIFGASAFLAQTGETQTAKLNMKITVKVRQQILVCMAPSCAVVLLFMKQKI